MPTMTSNGPEIETPTETIESASFFPFKDKPFFTKNISSGSIFLQKAESTEKDIGWGFFCLLLLLGCSPFFLQL